jgi:hypothetical protein
VRVTPQEISSPGKVQKRHALCVVKGAVLQRVRVPPGKLGCSIR